MFVNQKGESMKRSLKSLVASLTLICCLLLTSCGGDLAVRASRAVSAIPSVVRVLFPNADSKVFDALDAASNAFQQFANSKSADNWEKVSNAWSAAKPLLLRFSNTRIAAIVAVVDILMSQVIVPTSGMESVGDKPIVVKFSESDVKRLESLVK
jgi:hypothetical protein